ncbi:MAG: hypothetical protein D6828_01095, partial [Nitrospirae bacterium]
MPSGKLLLKGKIELLSPAIIGSGKDENSDLDIVRDSSGRPFIPATSFAGVLRHAIKLDNSYKDSLEAFWGSSHIKEPNKARQSSAIFEDLTPSNSSDVIIRDGVSINNKIGVAEEGAKFDYEAIERGALFNIYIEVNLGDKHDDFKKRMLATIVELLKSEKIRIGAKTNSGFGRIRLIEDNIYQFDFSKK